jgi:hypothetical protein
LSPFDLILVGHVIQILLWPVVDRLVDDLRVDDVVLLLDVMPVNVDRWLVEQMRVDRWLVDHPLLVLLHDVHAHGLVDHVDPSQPSHPSVHVQLVA